MKAPYNLFMYEIFVKQKSVLAVVTRASNGTIKATREFPFTNLLTFFSKKYKQTKLDLAKKEAISWAEQKIEELEK